MIETIFKSLPTLALIFVAVFIAILVLRFVLTILLNRSYENYLKIKKSSKETVAKWKKNYVKEDEVLAITKEIPKANSQVKAENRAKAGQSGSYELMPSNEQNQDLGQSEIVDFVKPIGFFTSMILGQKLTYLIQSAQVLNKRGNKGFWVSMIEAKDRAAGRQHGRGR
jgi:hypothetical protein